MLALAALVASSSASAAAGDTAPTYVPPVEAEVVDPFRPPDRPYGPGNRGLEYGTAAGAEVRASADGRVTFAGSVAGTRHVTVLHPDGVRTSYSFLEEVDVLIGQLVQQGDRLGTTAGHLHLGARQGDSYLDPESLFGEGPAEVRLVPFDDPPGEGERGERSALRQLIGGVGGALGHAAGGVADSVGSVAGWLHDDGLPLLRTAAHYANRFSFPASLLPNTLTALQAVQRARGAADRPCSQPTVTAPPPAERRVALLVAGLGSHGGSGGVEALDTGGLGYDPADVVRFSYAGGRTPDPTDAFPAVASTAYDPADTAGDLRTSASRLADLVETMAAESDGAPIDLYAHSQGGLVARLAVQELASRHGEAWLRRVGLLATLGTPHGGADLATATLALGSTRSGSRALRSAAEVAALELDATSVAVQQLSETSDLVADLARQPVPDIVPAVSIAARGDLLAPVPRTVAPGMTEVVVPLGGLDAHGDLPASPAVTRELGLARAGLPPTCQSFRDALLDQVAGEAISWAEDTVGGLAWLASGYVDRRAPLPSLP